MPFYAVANGRNIGIFLNWNDCNHSVKGYKNAIYKKFNTKEEAEHFIQQNNNSVLSDTTILSLPEQTPNQQRERVKQKQIASFFTPLHNSNIQKSNTSESTEENPVDFIPDYYVYTDGACSNNGAENACAGIGIFFGIDDIRNTSKKIEGKQTNNTAELSAIIETYSIIESDIVNGKKIAIVSDSEYALRCVSSYGEKCSKKAWNVDIPNKELVKTVYELYKNKRNIQFIHIKAHTNNTDIHSVGNDNADKLANMAIGLNSCPYNTSAKIYLVVPFIKNNEIKKWGGRWDNNKKKWFVYENNENIEQIMGIFSKE
jgi:ribonuclease HI